MVKLISCLLLFGLAASYSFPFTERYHTLEELELGDYPVRDPTDCWKYMCNTSKGPKMSNMTCVAPGAGIYYLQQCPEVNGTKLHCHVTEPVSKGDHYCVPQDSHLNSYPGEDCFTDADCVYGHCNTTDSKHMRCVGSLHKEFCTTDGECNPGLYCSEEFMCEPQGGPNSACTHSDQCQNNLGCNVTTVSGGTCIPYFSVPDGGYVSHCTEEGRNLCQSSTCIISPLPQIGQCITPPKSTKSLPVKCTSDSDCVGISGKQIFKGQCDCGMNPSGQAYCYPFLGDAPALKAVKDLQILMKTNETLSCNTVRRVSDACLHSLETTEAYNAYMSMNWVNYYPVLQENDACIKSIFNFFYWDSSSHALGYVVLGLLLLAN